MEACSAGRGPRARWSRGPLKAFWTTIGVTTRGLKTIHIFNRFTCEKKRAYIWKLVTAIYSDERTWPTSRSARVSVGSSCVPTSRAASVQFCANVCNLIANFPIFWRARSRLYRSQILQVNIRLKALAEIYTMHSFARLLESTALQSQFLLSNFAKFLLNFAECLKILATFQENSF